MTSTTFEFCDRCQGSIPEAAERHYIGARVLCADCWAVPRARYSRIMSSRPRDASESVVTVLRWAAFVPAGVAGGFVVGLLWDLLLRYGHVLFGRASFTAPESLWNRGVNSFVSGAAVVVVGALVAPGIRKTVPATILATLGVLLSLVTAVLELSRDFYASATYMALIGAGSIAGAIWVSKNA